VLNGPATRTLPSVQVVVAGEDIIVDLSHEVPAVTRV
jgi:hypothetical protein